MSKIKTAYATLEEVPEDLKKFHEVTDEGIFYNADGMKSAMKKERENATRAAEEAEALKAQIAELSKNRQEPEKPKDEPKESADNSEIEELKKSLAILQEARIQDKQEADKLRRESEFKAITDEAGLKKKLIPHYERMIDRDDKGFYVKDTDGLPAINSHTGQRLTLNEFFENERKQDPSSFKDVAQGSGFQAGTGLSGSQRRTQINASELNNLKKQKHEAIKNGDFKAIQGIEMQAAKMGAKI